MLRPHAMPPQAFLIAVVLSTALTAGANPRAVADESPVLLAEGLNNPESAVAGTDGRIYITLTGKPNVADGEVAVLEDGAVRVIARGLFDPRGIARHGDTLFVADLLKVWRIALDGTASVYADTDAFPVPPRFLNDIEVAANGDVYVSDSGTFTGNGAVFRITPDQKVSIAIDTKSAPALKGPNGILTDGNDHLLLADVATGKLYRASLADGHVEEIASGLGGADGVVRDAGGRIYVGDVRGGRVLRIDGPGAEPVVVSKSFKSAADIAIDGNRILVPDSRAGTLSALPIQD